MGSDSLSAAYRLQLTLTRRCSVDTYEHSLCTIAAKMWRRFSSCCDKPGGGVAGSVSDT